MNLAKQFRELGVLNSINPLPGDAQVVLYNLMQTFNFAKWPGKLVVRTQTLENNCSMTRKRLTVARNTLIQRGLIRYYQAKQASGSPSYQLVPLYEEDGKPVFRIETQNGTHRGTQDETQNGTQLGTPIKTKGNQTKHSVTNVTGDGQENQNQSASENLQPERKKGSAQKKKDEEEMPEEESSLYTRCIAIYNGFVIERTGMGAKIKPRSGKAMKEIIAYLSREARAKVKDRPQDEVEARVIQVWEGTLAKDTWDMLRPYLRNKIKLEDIEFEFVNILSEIKNGTNNQAGNTGANGTGGNGRTGQSAGTARGRGATVGDIQSAQRPGATDNQEREEFTPIEVVK